MGWATLWATLSQTHLVTLSENCAEEVKENLSRCVLHVKRTEYTGYPIFIRRNNR
jgi:hypothetical protein